MLAHAFPKVVGHLLMRHAQDWGHIYPIGYILLLYPIGDT